MNDSTAHFVLFYTDSFNDFIEQMLVSVKQNKSIAQQSAWNETICVLLRVKASKNYDKLELFSAIDFALSLQGNVESMINLISTCFRFFNTLEISQIMSMYFDLCVNTAILESSKYTPLQQGLRHKRTIVHYFAV